MIDFFLGVFGSFFGRNVIIIGGSTSSTPGLVKSNGGGGGSWKTKQLFGSRLRSVQRPVCLLLLLLRARPSSFSPLGLQKLQRLQQQQLVIIVAINNNSSDSDGDSGFFRVPFFTCCRTAAGNRRVDGTSSSSIDTLRTDRRTDGRQRDEMHTNPPTYRTLIYFMTPFIAAHGWRDAITVHACKQASKHAYLLYI